MEKWSVCVGRSSYLVDAVCIYILVDWRGEQVLLNTALTVYSTTLTVCPSNSSANVFFSGMPFVVFEEP